MNRQAVRDPVILPTAMVVWAAVFLFVLYPLGRLLVGLHDDSIHFRVDGNRSARVRYNAGRQRERGGR